MFKLVVVGGAFRAQEYLLNDGKNVIGRSMEASIQIDLPGISKKHALLMVKGNSVYLQDLQSANGTMVNSKVFKEGDIIDGDLIAIPGMILRLTHYHELENHQAQTNMGEGNTIEQGYVEKETVAEEIFGDKSEGIVGTLFHIFKTKIVPLLQKVNFEYEWSAVTGGLLAILVGVNTFITLAPVLVEHRIDLLKEIRLRAQNYAAQIERLNAVRLQQRELDGIDTEFLPREEGVVSYELVDVEGYVIRPRRDDSGGSTDPFTRASLDWAKSSKYKDEALFTKKLNNGSLGMAKRIKAYNQRTGENDLVGVVAIQMRPATYETLTGGRMIAYFRAFFLSLMISIIFFGLFYYLTVYPLRELAIKTERHLRKASTLLPPDDELNSKLLFSALDPIRELVKNFISKISDMQDGNSFEEAPQEDDQSFLVKLEQFMKLIPDPALIVDGDKKIAFVNQEAEDLLGFRETAASGEYLESVCRDKGISSTLSELIEDSHQNSDRVANAKYEISGRDYAIFAVSVYNRDNVPKGTLVSFREN